MSLTLSKNSKRPYPRLPFISEGESLTKTSFASEADINVIVARFLRTGQKPESPVPPSFLDTTLIPRGSDALMAVRAASLAFEGLPLALRKELDHDPRALEPWLADPANRDKAIQMGLISPPEPGSGPNPAPIDKTPGEGSK